MGHKEEISPSDLANLKLRLNQPLDAYQQTIATGIIGARIIDVPSYARDVFTKVTTTGTVSDTVLMPKVIRKGETAAADLLNTGVTTDDAAADGTEKKSVDFVSEALRKLEPGDTVYFEVTGAPTGGVGLFATMNIDQRIDDLTTRPLNIGGSIG